MCIFLTFGVLALDCLIGCIFRFSQAVKIACCTRFAPSTPMRILLFFHDTILSLRCCSWHHTIPGTRQHRDPPASRKAQLVFFASSAGRRTTPMLNGCVLLLRILCIISFSILELKLGLKCSTTDPVLTCCLCPSHVCVRRTTARMIRM